MKIVSAGGEDGLDTSTVNRMKRCGEATVRGQAPNIERVLMAL